MLQGEHSAILLTFIKLPFVIKIFVLSIFEKPFYTGFIVCHFYSKSLEINLITQKHYNNPFKNVNEFVKLVRLGNSICFK